MYKKHCKVLSKDQKNGTKTDKKIVHVEREEKRDPEVEMMM